MVLSGKRNGSFSVENGSVTGYAELEESHKDQVQLLVLHRVAPCA